VSFKVQSAPSKRRTKNAKPRLVAEVHALSSTQVIGILTSVAVTTFVHAFNVSREWDHFKVAVRGVNTDAQVNVHFELPEKYHNAMPPYEFERRRLRAEAVRARSPKDAYGEVKQPTGQKSDFDWTK
jgi:hypothetical protein